MSGIELLCDECGLAWRVMAGSPILANERGREVCSECGDHLGHCVVHWRVRCSCTGGGTATTPSGDHAREGTSPETGSVK